MRLREPRDMANVTLNWQWKGTVTIGGLSAACNLVKRLTPVRGSKVWWCRAHQAGITGLALWV